MITGKSKYSDKKEEKDKAILREEEDKAILREEEKRQIDLRRVKVITK